MTSLPDLVDSVLEVDDRIATLTLNRDDIRNALNGSQLFREIPEVVRWVSANSELSVLIITGAGKAFSSGANIRSVEERDHVFSGTPEQIQAAYRKHVHPIPITFAEAECVTIAAVNGPAIGAGCDLTLMCDIRISGESARFVESFLMLGLLPGDGGTWLLPRLVGRQMAASMLFRAQGVGGKLSAEIGLALECVANEVLMPRTREIAAEIAAMPPTALRYTKRLLNRAEDMSYRDHLDYAAALQSYCHDSEEHSEALRETLARFARKAPR